MNDLPIPKWLVPYSTVEAVMASADPDIIIQGWKKYHEANDIHLASQPKPKMSIKDLIAQVKTTPPVVPAAVVEQPKRKVQSDPAPHISDWTMMEATIWDNWNGATTKPKPIVGKRIKPHPYGLELCLWTQDPILVTDFSQDNKAWKGNTVLYPHANIQVVIQNLLLKESIDQEYFDALMEVITNSTPTCNFGLFSGKGGLRRQAKSGAYIPHQFVRVEHVNGVPTYCSIHIDGKVLTVQPHWVKTNMVGSLPQNAVSQNRKDFVGNFGLSGWAT